MPKSLSTAQPRRALLAAGLALFCGLALLAPAARADSPQVSVISPGGSMQTLALEALAGSEDVVGKPYVLRGGAGETTETVTGFSLAKLIDAAGADPYSFSYLEVQRPGGGAVLLSRQQVLDQGAFAEGPPVAYAASGGTGFLRPSSDAEDANGDDSFLAPQGITLVLRKGTPLRVKAKASTLKTKPGKPVEFSAVVEQAGAGEQLSYSWNFDDGKTAQGESVSHGFSERGSYKVVARRHLARQRSRLLGGGDDPGRRADRRPRPQGRRPQREEERARPRRRGRAHGGDR